MFYDFCVVAVINAIHINVVFYCTKVLGAMGCVPEAP